MKSIVPFTKFYIGCERSSKIQNLLTSVRPLFSSTTTIVLSTYVLRVVPFFVNTSVALFLYVLIIESEPSSASSCDTRSVPRSSNLCLSSSGGASRNFFIFSKILSVYFAAVYCSKPNGCLEEARELGFADPKRLRDV